MNESLGLAHALEPLVEGLGHFQGAGGNYGIKHGNHLFVKPSGESVATSLKYALSKIEIASQTLVNGTVPSMEWRLHLSLPHRFTVHTHSWLALTQLGVEKWKQAPDCATHDFPYWTPGSELFEETKTTFASASKEVPLIVRLANHGFLFAADTHDGISRLLKLLDLAQISAAMDVGGPVFASKLDGGRWLQLLANLPKEVLSELYPWDVTPDTSLARDQLVFALNKFAGGVESRSFILGLDPSLKEYLALVIWLADLEKKIGKLPRLTKSELENLRKLPEEKFRFGKMLKIADGN